MHTPENDRAPLAPGEGEIIEALGNRITIKVASASQLICDYSAAPRYAGPPLHVHPGFDETYLVLEGRLELTVGDERHHLESGGAAYVSGSTPHTFSNPDAARARFLSVCTPGGFEHYFRAVANADRRAIAEISERFGYRVVAR
jgi:mannose-6-phosphate isomerase-like protein (cupin superfamily)